MQDSTFVFTGAHHVHARNARENLINPSSGLSNA